MNFLFVFLGGGLGAIARYSISKIIPTGTNGFPFGTWVANIISCIILGFLLSKLLEKELSTTYQLLLITGFCGGFSTFSTFSAETLQLLQNGQSHIAISYVAASILVCLLAVWIGLKLGNIT